MLVAALAPALLLPGAAAAAAAASKRSSLVSQQDEKQMASSWQLDAFVDRMWDLSGPIMNNMGFSGLLGAFSAAALKVGWTAVNLTCIAKSLRVCMLCAMCSDSGGWWV